MVDFALSIKEQEIVEKYRDFVNRWIVPNRKKYDASGDFPWEIVKAAYDERIINGPLPVEYGGNGFSIFETSLASEELGAGCTGIGTTLDANSLALTPTLIAATEEQKKRVYGEIIEKKGVAAYCLTEPQAGSDVQGIKSTAILKGDKYILNGEKRFITNGQEACYLTVFAQVNPDKG
ncbi:acyl-CoA dehydrogenase family protein, partial [bacterium]|nr:acyl-CoA dehydrogenase family protein [bacterium]